MDIIYVDAEECYANITRRNSFEMSHLHYHRCYEIYVVIEGEIELVIQDKIFHGGEGDVFLVPEGFFHRTACKKFCLRMVINFSREWLNSYFRESTVSELLKCFDVFLIKLDKKKIAEIRNIGNKIQDYNHNDGIHHALWMSEILYTLSENINYNYKESSITSSVLASEILSYVNENYKTLFEIGEIAEKFYISKVYLSRIFKKYTGVTVMTYLNNCKMKSAHSMLVETKKPISEIADECGFTSPSYFSKVFKKVYRMSPVEYRMNNR